MNSALASDPTDELFKFKKNHPYYIYCPPIKQHSAGVVVLHRLCHLLNLRGFPAFLVIERHLIGKFGYPKYSTHSGLVTPVLTLEMAEQHFEEGINPIVVYPDTVSGRPLKSGHPVVYLLNYMGLLGGDKAADPNAQYLSYSQKIADKSPRPESVLFIPVSDPEFFHPPSHGSERSGSCYYAAKFKHFHGQRVGPEVNDSVEITRDLPTSQTRRELRELFWRSEVFYCYENSALAIEAALCGCPVVFVPNSYFGDVIAQKELGVNGFAWGLDEGEIARAKATVALFRNTYLSSYEKVDHQLRVFVDESQRCAASAPYSTPIDYRYTMVTLGYEGSIPIGLAYLMAEWNWVVRYHGLWGVIRNCLKLMLIKVKLWEHVRPWNHKFNLWRKRRRDLRMDRSAKSV